MRPRAQSKTQRRRLKTCDVEQYMTAEEKLAIELARQFPDWMQKDLATLREQRRCDRLPALVGRQILAWGFRRYAKDDVRVNSSARNSMAACRDAVRKTPPARAAFRKLLQAIHTNLSLESATDTIEKDKN